MSMRKKVDDLIRRRAAAKQMGGEARLLRQKERGKLDARSRLDLLLDAGTFQELGILATHLGKADSPTPADGVVCGTGLIDGRPVCVASYDFTVHGGSIGPVGERKVTRLRELALRERIPMIWLVDSAGARLSADPEEASWISQFAGTGFLFREQVVMSGVVSQVAAMVGPGAAGTAYIPGLADFVPMVKNIGSLALAGPALVKAVTGQDIAEQELGGSKVHSEVSGVADGEVATDGECVDLVKRYLSYFPSHCDELPPIVPCDDPIDRRDDAILDLLPDSNRKPYDMYKLIKMLVDRGEILDIKPRFGRSLITCLARIGGKSVGIVANQPMHMGGILENDSAD